MSTTTPSSRGSERRPSTRAEGAAASSTRRCTRSSGLARRRPGPHRALRAGRQPDGPRGDGRPAARRGARADDARARARGARGRPARHPGQGLTAPRRSSSTRRCATSRSSSSSGCRSGRATCASAAPSRRRPGELDVPVEGGGDDDPPRGHRRTRRRRRGRGRAGERAAEVLEGAAEARGERGRQARQAPGRRAVLRPRRPAGDRGGRVTEPLHEIAHISHAELLTPKPRGEPALLRRRPRDGGRGARGTVGLPCAAGATTSATGLKLTESDTSGMGPHGAANLEPGGAPAPRRPPSRRRASAWAGATATSATAPAYRCTDPDGHVFELLLRGRALRPAARARALAEEPAPALRRARRRRSSAWTTSTSSPPTSAASRGLRAGAARLPPARAHRARRRHRVGRVAERGASPPTSSSTPPTPTARAGACTTSPSGSTRARRCLRAADLFLDNDVPIEAAPSKHAIAQGFFLYGLEPGGNRVEVTTGGYFVFDPEYEPVVWSEAERRRARRGASRRSRASTPTARRP